MSEEIYISEEAFRTANAIFNRVDSVTYYDRLNKNSERAERDWMANQIQLLLNQRDTKIATLESEVGELRGLLGKTRQYVEDALRRNQEALKDSNPDSQFYGEDICSMPLLSKIDTALNSTKGEK